MPQPRRRTVISVEQALSMSHATLRFAQLGWRVVRVEATPAGGRAAGDPNRYIGREIAGPRRCSYYVAPNVGKEAIALNLKDARGRALLAQLVEGLSADVFCTNTLPARHRELGFDYETLRACKSDLIWCCISALGSKYPDVPGYDPMVQALCGYMDLTGDPDGPPMQCGPPIIDLKAGDEAFSQVLLALLEQAEGGQAGRRIDISMAQVAVSWLETFLPMLDMDSPPAELRRSGNQHRQFIPVNAYPTADGFVYVAVGSDAQWQRLVAQPMFAELAQARFATNEGRRAHKVALHRLIGELTSKLEARAVMGVLAGAAIPHAPITSIEGVFDLPAIAETHLSTRAPDGRVIRLPPPAASTAHLRRLGGQLPFAPDYGEQTDELLGEVGVDARVRAELRQEGVIA